MKNMSNTIWNEWWYTGRFHNKPYPFSDNYCSPRVKSKKKKNSYITMEN